MEYNIICDVAGNYNTLMALIKQMPASAIPLSVGDMIDRGPNSKAVLDYFMDHGEAIRGNHEDFLLETLNKPIGLSQDIFSDRNLDYYSAKTQLGCYNVWARNGGIETLESFGIRLDCSLYGTPKMEDLNTKLKTIPTKYTDWLNGLPLYKEIDNLIITHAAIGHSLKRSTVWKNYYELDDSVLWNRADPSPIKGKIQIFGHNWEYKEYKHNGEIFAYCIDNNHNKELVGIHYPSMKIYKQPFLKE
jgi:hypothetical protein